MSNIVERAFALAPECSTMLELKKRLKDEGLTGVEVHIGGLGTRRQLRARFNGGAGVRSARSQAE